MKDLRTFSSKMKHVSDKVVDKIKTTLVLNKLFPKIVPFVK